jgi:uncharacterized membrane protein YfcA
MDASPSLLLFAALVFLLAGMVKGVIGMGLPTIAMALMTLAVPPAQAAALLVVPSFVTNVWQGLAGGALRATLARTWPLLGAIPIGCVAAAQLVFVEQARAATALLGLLLLGYAAIGLMRPALSIGRRVERTLSPAVGLVTGAITAATGVSVLPVAPYLAATDLAKGQIVQTLGLSFAVAALFLGLTLRSEDLFGTQDLVASSALLAPAFIGMLVGARIRAVVSEALFRNIFFLGLLGLGAIFAARGLLAE